MRPKSRPNILLIYTDQQRQDSLACYGNPLAVSPNLDKLASEGARFDHFYVNNPVCSPSRMSFLTGRYPASLGVGSNGIPFPDEEATPINRLLSPYNYTTAQIGKLHFDPHSNRDHCIPGRDYGFDTFILSDEPGPYEDAYIQWVATHYPEDLENARAGMPHWAEALQKIRGISKSEGLQQNVHEPYIYPGKEETTHTSFVASETCEFIRNSGNNPFFCIAGIYAPHTPVNPPKRFMDMFDPLEMPLPKLSEEEDFQDFLKDVSEDKWREIVAAYYALCAHVDDSVGQMMKALEESGKADNTIVIFTTDHGEYLGDHGKLQKGPPCHDCVVRAPFIMRYPGMIKPGTVVDEIVEGVDFVPTMLDYAAIQTPKFVQGKSFKGLLDGQTGVHKDAAFIEAFEPYKPDIHWSCIKTKKFMYYTHHNGDEILYDRLKNPDENVNVIKDPEYATVISQLRMKVIQRLQEAAFTEREKFAMY